MKRKAILSVTDKSGLKDFAKELVSLGFEILSTGGTAKTLTEENIPVTSISDYTTQKEILGGRVKTLHPKIHGGILFDRDNKSHLTDLEIHNIEAIDLVVVNLYDFKKASEDKLSLEKAIESIDIGGPTMLRAAAKNYQHTSPIIDPEDYPTIIEELKKSGSLSSQTRIKLAYKTFSCISNYDQMISQYFSKELESSDDLVEEITPQKIKKLRYGENPHQKGFLFKYNQKNTGFTNIKILQGKELSYNNYMDLDAASSLVYDLMGSPAIAIIKHTNPCGISSSDKLPLAEIYENALAGDPKSAFGGILACNREIDEASAIKMGDLFLECIIAPSVSEKAKALFARKKNLRLIEADFLKGTSSKTKKPGLNLRSIRGALLVQDEDNFIADKSSFQCPTDRKPTAEELLDLEFAMVVCKHVKSNGIVFIKNKTAITIGAGQMSRIDSAEFSAEKALKTGKSLEGAVMASDAFFPFRDCVDLASKYKVSAIIQPGGSIRDKDSIDACNEHNMSMVLTGHRHFKH